MDFYRENRICHCRRCNGIIHAIKKGDTLYRLSKIYQVALEDLIDANPDIDVYHLMPGERICIPLPRPEPAMMPRLPSMFYSQLQPKQDENETILSEEEAFLPTEQADDKGKYTGEELLKEVLEDLNISLENFNKNLKF